MTLAKALDVLLKKAKHLRPEDIIDLYHTSEEILEAVAPIQYGYINKFGKPTEIVDEYTFADQYRLMTPEDVW